MSSEQNQSIELKPAMRGQPQLQASLQLSDRLSQSPAPRHQHLSPHGLLTAWQSSITLHDATNGNLLAAWPKGSLAHDSHDIPLPVFLKERVAALDPENGDLIWLYSINLEEFRRFKSQDLLKDLPNASILSLGLAQQNRILLACANPNDPNGKTTILTCDESGNVTSPIEYKSPSLADLVQLRDRIVILDGDRLTLLTNTEAQSYTHTLSLDSAMKRMWPSPDGRSLLISGEGATRVSLIQIDQNEDQPLRVLLEGSVIQIAADKPAGWSFFKNLPPHLGEELPFLSPHALWSEDSKFVFFGDANGHAAIFSSFPAQAAKLMTTPGKPFWPLVLSSSNEIQYIGNGEIWRMTLNANLAKDQKSNKEMSTNSSSHEVEPHTNSQEPQSSEFDSNPSANKNATLKHLLYLAGLAIVSAFLWYLLK